MDNLTVAGKRKTCVAKATIRNGSGIVKINKIPYTNLNFFHHLMIKEPLDITKQILGDVKFDIDVTTSGGGTESMIEASRLAIAKALVKFSNSAELKKAMVEYDRNILVADTRRKEPYKPGTQRQGQKGRSLTVNQNFQLIQ